VQTYQSGERIINNKYTVEKLLGKGAFGEVYLCKHLDLQVWRAIKVVHRGLPGLGSTIYDELYQRFQQEARIGARIKHEHIIQVFDFEKMDDFLFLVLEYAEGGSLLDRLESMRESGKWIDESEILKIGLEVAKGLTELHSHQIIHRDLKPSNILFGKNKIVKIADLGLAQIPGGMSQRSMMGSMVVMQPHPGTPDYMSPEQRDKFSALQPPSDVYTLGVILFELLTRKNPYYEEPGTRVCDIRSSISMEISTLIENMLTEDPSQRPWNGARLQEAIKVLINHVDVNQPKVHSIATILNGGPHNEKFPIIKMAEDYYNSDETIDNLETTLDEKINLSNKKEKLPLRSYIDEIKNLIDDGQIDLAIAHCKHILQIYPKHIDSYRLLGKALIEKQKFADALNIFQRVLSAVPDDFVSHIRVSIIREDENNLKAAIWHMERAFEIQPSNEAIQDELRRLYIKRDGVAPPKIKLSNGALVRMYMRGELYNQAIAEILAALTEEPSRVDLEVILAQLYFLQGKHIETIEICSKIITKLPFCYEVNRILSIIIKDSSNSENYKVYRQRINEMDPYNNYLTDNTLSSTDVPDGAVMIDYLR